MKVVYFKDNPSCGAERAEEAAGEPGYQPVEIVPDDITRIKDNRPSSAALLNEGIETSPSWRR